MELRYMLHSLKLTCLHLKMNAKGRGSFQFGALGLFSGALAVSFREGISPILLDKSGFNLCLLENPRFMRFTKTKTINVEYEGERKHCCILLPCLILRRNSRNFWEVACLTEVFEAGGETIK